MDVQELAPGLWRWTAPHPEWEPNEDWEEDVSCVYYEAPDSVVLFDPQLPPERETFFAALDRDVDRLGLPVVILLTASWHDRSSAEVAARYGARIGGVPDGIDEHPFPEAEESVFWLPQHATLIAGDVLNGDGKGGFVVFGGDEATTTYLRTALPALLELPVERILVSHGEPVLENGLAALEAALRA